MSTEAALRWELHYPSGLAFREPGEHCSIRAAKPGAIQLALVTDAGRGVFLVDLRPDWRPVFYRQRHSDLGGEAGVLDRIVFGRVRAEVDQQTGLFAGRLWQACDGLLSDCPPEAIDQTAITLCALGG